MSLSVLFVDDDPFLLQAIERSLMFSCPDWSSSFASSGESAIELLGQQSFDVVVSDMRMPGINGAELLHYVSDLCPASIRIILSGQSDLECSFQMFGPAHQYLSKPCQVGELQAVLEHALSLRDHLQREDIKRMVSSLTTLTLSDNFIRLCKMLESKTVSANEVGLEISKDVGITSKILQMANSPLFGTERSIADAGEAVSFLGFDVIHSLVFSIGVFTRIENPKCNPNFVNEITVHSVNVGTLANAIAKWAGASPKIQSYSLLAGLLHDLGKLVLAHQFSEGYSDVLRLAAASDLPCWQSEFREFKATHADVAGYLLSMWGIANPVVDAVTYHHQPELANVTKFNPLMAVHLANQLERLNRESDSSETLQKLQAFCDATGISLQLNDFLESAMKQELSR